ncbi:lactate permease LctP family transporter [Marinomonas sp. THO17]
MTKRSPWPAHIALPFTALLVALVQVFSFQADILLMLANAIAGVLAVLTPISIVAGAILLNRILYYSGAEAHLSAWLKTISDNDIAQLMIIGWAFAFMIEGASGFGTPAAIAAPILVGLGFPVLRVAILTLTMNSIPVSFGAVGTPLWFGLSGLNLTTDMMTEIASLTALLNTLAAFVVPIIALSFVVTWKYIWRNSVFIILSILSCTLPYYFVAQWNYEFPALIGGAVGLILSIGLAKLGIGLVKQPDETFDKKHLSNLQLIKVITPFTLLIIVLVVTRLPQLPFKSWLNDVTPMWSSFIGIGQFEISRALVLSVTDILTTQVSWQYKSLYVPALIPFVLVVLICIPLYHMSRQQVFMAISDTFKRLLLPCLSLIGALVMVNLMMQGDNESPMNILANGFAQLLGGSWLYAAAWLGALGSFFSGSATVSNLTFSGIQYAIAEKVGLPVSVILALQSVGAAMGNMVCINNIIAVSTILGFANKEGVIIKRTILPMLAYGLIAGGVAWCLLR